jgi:hypothetical protein
LGNRLLSSADRDQQLANARLHFYDDRIALFLRSVALGLDIDTSLAVSGWPNGQYWNWIRQGGSPRSKSPDPDPQEPYKTFCEILEMAYGTAKATAVFVIADAIRHGSVPASMWWLERRFPREFGLGTRFEINTGSGETRTPVIVMMPDNGRRLEPYDGELTESVIDIT